MGTPDIGKITTTGTITIYPIPRATGYGSDGITPGLSRETCGGACGGDLAYLAVGADFG